MSREIYLDNSATTRPYDEVIDFVNHISREVYGNPSSLHTKGIEAERMVRNAREIVAKSLGVSRMRLFYFRRNRGKQPCHCRIPFCKSKEGKAHYHDKD